jgi:hypothetical protein
MTFNGTVRTPNLSVPPETTSSGPFVSVLSPALAPVIWDVPSAVPTSLRTITLGQLAAEANKNPAISLQITTNIIVIGLINPLIPLTSATTTLVFTYGGSTTIPTGAVAAALSTISVNVNAARTSSGSWLYSGPTISRTDIATSARLPTGVSVTTTAGTFYRLSNFSINVGYSVQLTLRCSGASVINNVCTDFCNQSNNRESCLQNFEAYCLPPNGGNTPPMVTDPNCRDFFSNYIQQTRVVPADFSDKLDSYCQTKYQGFGALFNIENDSSLSPAQLAQKQIDRQLCGCHMQPIQYDSYVEQLNRVVPGIASLAGGNKYCLFEPCANGPFKNKITGPQCSVSQCVNVAGFTNSGTFTGSAQIVQSASGCANLRTANQPAIAAVTEEESIFPIPMTYLVIIIIVVVIIVIFLIVFIFIPRTPKSAQIVTTV